MSLALPTAEDFAGLVFWVFVAATVAGALIAVNAVKLIRAVAGLALCFIGVAGLYYFLGSPFVALMQVLIYVGAVCVTIIFAVMLAETAGVQSLAKRGMFVSALTVIVSGAVFWALSALACKTPWKELGPKVNSGSVADVGVSLLTTYNLSFELISVVLLAAIVGSLVLARVGRDKR
jgi:NADH-quinone oxidoreductase subunit J